MTPNVFHKVDLSQFSFLVTGGAGFIGSNLVEYLVTQGAKHVKILDNLATGNLKNISQLLHLENVTFLNGDIRSVSDCQNATQNVDFVFHQAALGSVPRSINDPATTNEVNITGFLNILNACRNSNVKRIVYASSSSVYGSDTTLPKKEEFVGLPLSPYAVTKKTNELYADVFYKTYGLEVIGLRYFNIFGPNQSPEGEYAALIPKFIKAILTQNSPVVYGDGMQARDFTFVENAIQANIKAIFAPKEAVNKVYNIAVGENTSVLELFKILKEISTSDVQVVHAEPRKGEIRDSLADISNACEFLEYMPTVNVKVGLEKTWNWFLENKEILINK